MFIRLATGDQPNNDPSCYSECSLVLSFSMFYHSQPIFLYLFIAKIAQRKITKAGFEPWTSGVKNTLIATSATDLFCPFTYFTVREIDPTTIEPLNSV